MPSKVSAIRKDLAELAKRSNRRLIDEVRDALPEIEQAVAAGASHADICATFALHGVKLSESSLTTYLYRLRRANESPSAASPARKTSPRGKR